MKPNPIIRVLAISGSLRRGSLNTALLEAAAIGAPEGVHVVLFKKLEAIPPFNPDHDISPPPPAIDSFRRSIREADAVLICSPEYAHGVPGVLKNALDWLVASGELVNKPVAAINVSARSVIAQASLLGTIEVMNALLVREACATIPLNGAKMDAQGILGDRAFANPLRLALAKLVQAAESTRAQSAQNSFQPPAQ